jgi:hypothetical protein
MRHVGPLLVLGTALLTGCSGAAAPAEPGIAGRSAVVVEERSTCEALARVDLGRVADDPAGRERSDRALRAALERAPEDLRQQAGDEAAVIAWFNQRCGGSR